MSHEENYQKYKRIGEELISTEPVEIVKLSEAAAREAQDTSVSTPSGIPGIDESIDGGFREGDFTIISGIPGDGKTTLARMITLNLTDSGMPCLWFSHEMTTRELWDSFEKMGAKHEMISYVPIDLEDDIDWMLAQCDEAIAKFGVKAIFIDTLGDIVRSVKSPSEMGNHSLFLAQLCKDLRRYAIAKKVMIFAVAHATKNTRSKTNETDNSDIANSNGIPAAATNIFHIWRDPESDVHSFLKIGKSRRDGTKKGWKFRLRFEAGRLISEGGRHLLSPDEESWRKF